MIPVHPEDAEWLLRIVILEVDAEEQRDSMRLPQRRDPERYVRMRALIEELREWLAERSGG